MSREFEIVKRIVHLPVDNLLVLIVYFYRLDTLSWVYSAERNINYQHINTHIYTK